MASTLGRMAGRLLELYQIMRRRRISVAFGGCECPGSLIHSTKLCHPERSLARSLRQAKSKDLSLFFLHPSIYGWAILAFFINARVGSCQSHLTKKLSSLDPERSKGETRSTPQIKATRPGGAAEPYPN